MILYHGSNLIVKKPILDSSKRRRDFGRGFYLTSDYDQARKWSKLSTNRRKSGKPTISCFEIEDSDLNNLNAKNFGKTPNKDWLDYVSKNRKTDDYSDDFDIVIGPVANDQTARCINNYIDGYVSTEETIRKLLTQRLKDQYTFKTEIALKKLKFKKCEVIE